MNSQKIFKRTEKKYRITSDKYNDIIDVITSHTHPDENRQARIFSLYFDTPTDILIRRSIDKPVYKEKLRLRAYGIPDDTSKVFVELKKKYKKTVYKRRAAMTYKDARMFLAEGVFPANYESQRQILSEISWFIKSYQGLAPSMLISYDRKAYYGINDSSLRITFDSDIRWKESRTFPTEPSGELLIGENDIIMEIKISDAMPLWLVRLLSENEIYPTSFSKVGTAYKQKLLKGETKYA